MRILHTIAGREWGGLEHRVVRQSEWLNAHGIPVWIATPPDGATWHRARAAGMTVLPVPFIEMTVPARIKWLRRILDEHRISILDCHGNADSKAALACRDLAAVVRTVHVTPRPKRSLIQQIKWQAGYDRIIAVSQSIAEQLQRNGIFVPSRDAVIGEWAEPEFFLVPPLIEPLDPELHVAMVGMLRPDKGPDLAVATFRLLRDAGIAARLVIAGEATTEHRSFAAALRAYVAGSGLPDIITFMGYCENVATLLAQCHVVMVPSRSEAQSRIAAQAMAAGRPVVAFNIGGLPELVHSGRTGWLVPAGDIAAMAGCLRYFARNAAAICTLGANARAFAETYLKADTKMKQTVEVYGKALTRFSRVPSRAASFSMPALP
jgi:glycosyltransferase involved in cell wall biosynthesis